MTLMAYGRRKIGMHTVAVRTQSRCEMVDVTGELQQFVRESGVRQGAVIVFVPHTTAGCTINENADPSVKHDVLLTLDRLIPRNNPQYLHAEGNSDAHVKASLVGSSETILVENGRLALGTWQAVYFAEFDGPRTRQMHVRVIAQQ